MSKTALKNTKPAVSTSSAGAHSSDGKFTHRELTEPGGAVRVTRKPAPLSTHIPGVRITVSSGFQHNHALVKVESTDSVTNHLPDFLDQESKLAWLDDNQELVMAYAPQGMEDDWRLIPDELEVPTENGSVTPQQVDAALEGRPHRQWNNMLNTQLAPILAKESYQGYRPGDDPELHPENAPYQINGTPSELTGQQRATTLAMFREHKGTFFRATSNFYGRSDVEWTGEDGRMNRIFIAPDGEIDRAEIAPPDWESRPWRLPVKCEGSDFEDFTARVQAARERLR